MAQILFIRVLEACNAGCDMCGYAFSRDGYRFGAAELRAALPRLAAEGVRVVRLTGGEPLMHREVLDLVRAVADHGLRPSIISNGMLLPKLVDALVDAGLAQIIVSIDGAAAATHDQIRNIRGLWDLAVKGLRAAVARGLRTRVNTVCGPANFREMPALQALLSEWGVRQWELSSLKLERPLDYTAADAAELDDVVDRVYVQGPAAGLLAPMGKPWCGAGPDERRRYLEGGVTPRPDGVCHVVRQVRYLDARQRTLYPCSLLPHRPLAAGVGMRVADLAAMSTRDPEIQAIADRFAGAGPRTCTGCSATAAGFSNDIADGRPIDEWSY